MSIEIAHISDPERVRKIIETEEGHFADVKAIEAKPAKLTEDMSAFSNADGGELFIGIDQGTDGNGRKTRTWRGFADMEAANGHIQAFERYFPLGSEFQYQFLTSAFPGRVLHVTINKAIGVIRASNNIPYLRRGAQSLPQNTPELIKRLEQSKGVHSTESDFTNADLSLVTGSDIVKDFIKDAALSATPEEFLRKQALIKDGKVTIGAVLLFADEPQAVLPKQCGIKVYRFKTSSEGSRDAEAFIPRTVEGCLYKQIYSAVNLTKEIVDAIPTMGVGNEFGKVEYPQRTLHEFITNAVIHRDYSLKDDIHIRIFDNRIEFQSPGRLPANMTVKNLTTQRAARNGAIQRILNKFIPPPNRDVGEGIKTATEAMTKQGLEKPSFEQVGNSFVVTIKHEKRATAELAIMEYLETNETVNNKQAREITFIHEDWRVKGIFRRMEKSKMIKQVPGTKTSQIKYRKWTKEDDQQPELFPL